MYFLPQVVKVTLGIVTEHWNVALEFPSQDLGQGQEQEQPQLMPLQKEVLRRQWLEVLEFVNDSAPKLRFKSLDRGSGHAAALR
jgi:hypothetical protein